MRHVFKERRSGGVSLKMGDEKWEQTDNMSAESCGLASAREKADEIHNNEEQLSRENAMSRLIRLIGNLGAPDFQGFVCSCRCQNHKASQRVSCSQNCSHSNRISTM